MVWYSVVWYSIITAIESLITTVLVLNYYNMIPITNKKRYIEASIFFMSYFVSTAGQKILSWFRRAVKSEKVKNEKEK